MIIKFLNKNLWIILTIGCIILCLVYTIIQAIHHVPHDDETALASITQHFIKFNKFYSGYLIEDSERLEYGPVYFFIQKVVASVIGFGMWQFRVLNIVAGISSIMIFWKIAKDLNISRINIFILIASIVFNPRFLFGMVNGRMELFILTLFIGGYYLFIKSNNRNYVVIIISGIILSLAFLSSPRIGFYFLAFVFSFVVEFIESDNRKRTIIKYSFFCVSIIIPIFIWIFNVFGSISAYINSIVINGPGASHFGVSIFAMPNQIPATILWLIACIYIFRLKRNMLNPILITLFSIPIFHWLFIKEIAPYSSMLMPFVFLGIIIAVNSAPKKVFSIFPGILALYFTLKFISNFSGVLSSLELTNSKSFNTFYKSQGITNKNVLADAHFYYTITEHSNKFTLYSQAWMFLSKETVKKYDIEYAVISKENFNEKHELLNECGFRVISEYSTKKSKSMFDIITEFGHAPRFRRYDCFVLKRE